MDSSLNFKIENWHKISIKFTKTHVKIFTTSC